MAPKAVRFRFFAIALRYCMATSASKLRHARVDLMACCCFLLQPRTTATANTTATPGFRLKSRRRKVARRWLWSRRAQGRAAYDKRDDCYVFIPLSCSRANEVFVCIQCSQRPWSPVHGHVNPACLKQQDFVSFCGFCVLFYVTWNHRVPAGLTSSRTLMFIAASSFTRYLNTNGSDMSSTCPPVSRARARGLCLSADATPPRPSCRPRHRAVWSREAGWSRPDRTPLHGESIWKNTRIPGIRV